MSCDNHDELYDETIITEAYNEIQKKKNYTKGSSKSRKIKTEKDVRKEKIEKAKFEKRLKSAKAHKLGFTNKLAVSLVCIMVLSLFMGFALACFSIYYQYTGALACFTICVTPLDTCLGIVLCRVVDKSKAENLGADGTGIAYMTAKAAAFQEAVSADEATFEDSPSI